MNEITITVITVLNIFCVLATILLTLYNYRSRDNIGKWLDEHDELYKQSLRELLDSATKLIENKVNGDKK